VPAERQAMSVFRYRDFRVWWLSSLMSNTGTMAQTVAVPIVLDSLTGKATWVGFGTLASSLPTVFVGPLAGSLADRHPRRSVLLCTQTAATILSIVLAVSWGSGLRSPWLYVALMGGAGTISGLGLPSWQSIVTEMVPREELANAVTLNSASFNAARAFGPSIGAVILALSGPGWVFAFNTVSYSAVLTTLWRRPASNPATVTATRPRVMREFRSTLRHVHASRGLTTAVVLGGVLGLVGNPLAMMVVPFARRVYHASGARTSLLAAAIGTGAVLVAPVLTARTGRVRPSTRVRNAIVCYCGAMLLLAAVPVIVVGGLALLAVGASHIAANATINSVIQLDVDDAWRGKVMSVYLMTVNAGTPVGAMGMGVLVDRIGARQTVAAAAIAMLTVTAVVAVQGRFESLDTGRERHLG
jgi:MFS family permease